MSKYKYEPLWPKDLKTYPLKSRKSKVSQKNFGKPFKSDPSFWKFIDSLPDILAAKDFKTLLHSIRNARKKEKPIIVSMGAHVIKVGLNPLLIDLMQRGWINGLALNGAGIIHDFEIAFSGKTSEEVKSQIAQGDFGMARETGEFLNKAIHSGSQIGIGMGESIGKLIHDSDFPYKKWSLLSSAFELNIPVTVHVGVGTDIIHFHPHAEGSSIGKTSLQDFFLFCSLIKNLEGGGIYINIGSAVVLPEVFLKAVSYVRNRGGRLENFHTAVFDFNTHYRPLQNIVQRPFKDKKGKGFYFIGHHEIMIPLLAACLKSISGREK
ncbi:MAG: hypothetical protein GF421_13560 [Candidatus Aminicenantes bacterium]|nr:hypothetical protein [Candidatus Aminicenantes bacterium]